MDQFRTRNRKLQIRVLHQLSGYTGVESVLEQIYEFSAGLEDALFEVELQYNYGDHFAVAHICGWRDASDEEKKQHRQQKSTNKKKVEAAERQTYERLKEKYG